MPQIKFTKYIQEKDVKIKDEESDHFYSIKKILNPNGNLKLQVFNIKRLKF